jgi:hypothetical protein
MSYKNSTYVQFFPLLPKIESQKIKRLSHNKSTTSLNIQQKMLPMLFV